MRVICAKILARVAIKKYLLKKKIKTNVYLQEIKTIRIAKMEVVSVSAT